MASTANLKKALGRAMYTALREVEKVSVGSNFEKKSKDSLIAMAGPMVKYLFPVPSGTLAITDLHAYGDVYINYDGPDMDSYLYFYDNSSPTGRSLKWNNTDNRFEFSTTTYSIGTFSASNLQSRTNIYINYDGGNTNSYLYFYNNSSPTGAYLQWDNANSNFYFNKDLYGSAAVFCGAATTTDNDTNGFAIYSSRADDFLALGTSYYAFHYGLTFAIPFDDGNGTAGGNLVISNYWGASFYTSGLERVRINYNGEVGIGKQAAHAGSYKLDVAGNVGVDGYVTSLTSGSIFRTLTTLDNTLIAGNCEVGTLQSRGNVYINSNGGDGDSYLYFYENSSATGRYLKWADSSNRFEVNDTFLTVNGSLASSQNVYVKNTGPDGDSYLYFYENSSATGASLMWDDSMSNFHIDQDVRINNARDLLLYSGSSDSGWSGGSVIWRPNDSTYTKASAYIRTILAGTWGRQHLTFGTGNYYDKTTNAVERMRIEAAGDVVIKNNLEVDGDIKINAVGGDGDSYLYFYENTSETGAYLTWDDSETAFSFSHPIQVLTSGSLFSTLTAYSDVQIGGELDMSTNKITNVVDPTADQEAATKKYVDTRSTITVALYPNVRLTDWSWASTDLYIQDINTGVGNRESYIYMDMPEGTTTVVLDGYLSVTSV